MIDYKCNNSFENWLNYLVNIIASAFQIQPDEINFPNRGGTTGKNTGTTMNEGSTQKSKMKQSQDKGLEPLFNYIEDFINNEILRYIPNGKNYMFRFSMGDDEQALEQLKIIEQKEKNGMTINEARQLMHLPKIGKLDKNNVGDLFGGSAVVVQMLQYLTSTDTVTQAVQQGKNTIDPQKADHHQPDKGMPATAAARDIDSGKTGQSDKQKIATDQPDATNNTD